MEITHTNHETGDTIRLASPTDDSSLLIDRNRPAHTYPDGFHVKDSRMSVVISREQWAWMVKSLSVPPVVEPNNVRSIIAEMRTLPAPLRSGQPTLESWHNGYMAALDALEEKLTPIADLGFYKDGGTIDISVPDLVPMRERIEHTIGHMEQPNVLTYSSRGEVLAMLHNLLDDESWRA